MTRSEHLSAAPGRPGPCRWARLGVGAAAALAFAWFTAGFTTFTWPARVAVFAGGVAVLAAAALSRPTEGRDRRRAPADRNHLQRSGLWVWTAWIAAVVGWELWGLFSPRATHPTISSLIDGVIVTHPARAVAVLLWLLLGWWLTRR